MRAERRVRRRTRCSNLAYGSFVVELEEGAELPDASDQRERRYPSDATCADYTFAAGGETRRPRTTLQETWERALEGVFPYRGAGEKASRAVSCTPDATAAHVCTGPRVAKPRVVIPVFPGTNCEYDTAHAFERAGAEAHVLVVNNLTPQAVTESAEALVDAIRDSQIVMLPGGFSGGDEPDGSAKFITAFFRDPGSHRGRARPAADPRRPDAGHLQRLPGARQAGPGALSATSARWTTACPTLTFNTIGRHQSRLVRHPRRLDAVALADAACEVGDVHTVAISHGEGRFVASPETVAQLKANGQIATQYVDADGVPGMDLAREPQRQCAGDRGHHEPRRPHLR